MLNDKSQVALHSYDIVTYYSNNLTKGNENIFVEFKNSIYLFSNEDNKKSFALTPEKFLPQYEGHCAMSMSEGQKIIALPDIYHVRSNKLYLFTSDGMRDIKTMWINSINHRIKAANYNWNNLNHLEPN